MKMDLPAPVARALSELERAGHQGYVVGGCVRDSLMGRTPGDYDITTSALPEQVQACFSGERVVPTGIKPARLYYKCHGIQSATWADRPVRRRSRHIGRRRQVCRRRRKAV